MQNTHPIGRKHQQNDTGNSFCLVSFFKWPTKINKKYQNIRNENHHWTIIKKQIISSKRFGVFLRLSDFWVLKFSPVDTNLMVFTSSLSFWVPPWRTKNNVSGIIQSLGIQSPKLRMVSWKLNTMHFGGDWTSPSLSENMAGCLGSI